MQAAQPRGVGGVLEALASTTLLGGIALIDTLADAARDDPDAATAPLVAATAGPDQLVAIAATHALAHAGTPPSRSALVELLREGPPFLREHAAWALAGSPPVPGAVGPLRGLAAAGGFTGTLAEATLEAWGDVASRAAPEVATIVPAPRPGRTASGITVAQLFLHADIDGTLSHAGQGDTGGIATLLVHLGDALLAGHPRIARVLTLSRGRPGDEPDWARVSGPGHHYLSIPLRGPFVHAPDAWPLRTAVRDGLRHLLRAAAPVDVLHLRMADVASWAAAGVARELGIPIVVTLAPDPHALIAAREDAGTLDRTTFGDADLAEHLVFRVRLLRDLATQAARCVVLPRPADDLRELAILPDAGPPPVVVAEGIDLAPLRAAQESARRAARGQGPAHPDPAVAALDAVLRTLPLARRHLPLAITVGRLHRVKGMATLVEAWAPALADRCNLLVVGGDLVDPSDDEAEQLALIDAAVTLGEGPARGLLLAGHRSNATVAAWLAAVRFGRPGLCAPGGVYVSASLKEEFGLAILEALASGLVVVAPNGGGPATYVEDGVTGVLTDTTAPAALAGAVASALDLARSPDAEARADRAQRLVAERYSIETMATALATLYEEVAR